MSNDVFIRNATRTTFGRTIAPALESASTGFCLSSLRDIAARLPA